MSTRPWFRLPVTIALGLLVVRSALHGVFALTERYQPETSIAVILDLPTMVTYILLTLIGRPLNIHGFVDLRFFIIGSVTWLVTGFALGYLAYRFRERSSGRAASGLRP